MSTLRSVANKAIATAAVVGGLLATGVGTATAGTGIPPQFGARHIYICAPTGGSPEAVWWANVTGYNEKGNYISDSPKARIGNGGACVKFQPKWWWRGEVAIHWFFLTNNGFIQSTKPEWTPCTVSSGPTTDFICRGPRL
jgi:hypothetical protein